jgi:hypothetical protein
MRFHVLPWVLGALVLRALIPIGLMPGSTSLTAMLCGSQARSERIDIPGAAPLVHCDDCLLPMLGAPPTLSAAWSPPSPGDHSAIVTTTGPHSRFALVRAQIPRAPPAA